MVSEIVIGVDIGGTGTKGALVDPTGSFLGKAHVETDPEGGTRSILSVVEDLVAQAAEKTVEVAAVGVGAAGFVDARSRAITFSPNIVYDRPDVAAAVEERASIPTFVENDANAAAWGERQSGAARGMDDVAMLTLGTGVGSGVIIRGRLLRGATGAGAEMGHTVIDPRGPDCRCGLKGCLEQMASGGAIGRMGREAAAADPASSMLDFAGSVQAVTARHVAQAARQQDEAAKGVLLRAGRALGIGLSNIVNIFDPRVIVLGGSVVGAGEAYLGPARDTLADMTSRQRRRPARLEVAALGNTAGIVGAAALARAHLASASSSGKQGS